VDEPILTNVINMPCPASFTSESIALLQDFTECSDDYMRTTPVLILLKEKWATGAFKFFLTQFILFMVSLVSLILTVTFPFALPTVALYCLVGLAFLINTYFLVYELLQMVV